MERHWLTLVAAWLVMLAGLGIAAIVLVGLIRDYFTGL